MQIHEKENSPRAHYNLNTNITQIMITESSSEEAVDNGAAWHQRSSWVQPLTTDTLFRLSLNFWVRHRKI